MGSHQGRGCVNVMLSLKKTPVLLALLLVLGGCVPGVLYALDGVVINTPPPAVDPPKTDFVVDKTFDQAWKDLAILALHESFAIDDYDKASGSMTLRLDNSKFVECFPPVAVGLKGEMRIAFEARKDARTRKRRRVRGLEVFERSLQGEVQTARGSRITTPMCSSLKPSACSFLAGHKHYRSGRQEGPASFWGA